jgi:hypothetical protein
MNDDAVGASPLSASIHAFFKHEFTGIIGMCRLSFSTDTPGTDVVRQKEEKQAAEKHAAAEHRHVLMRLHILYAAVSQGALQPAHAD